ncbi:MAG: hypothetical protein KatS3mg038_2320 [Candidatus Kapaibacterium sp.]|nr:MAG: hypothetical protein KatS3mg038_2320 [Candidatus Kapabacteria bacterium]
MQCSYTGRRPCATASWKAATELLSASYVALVANTLATSIVTRVQLSTWQAMVEGVEEAKSKSESIGSQCAMRKCAIATKLWME